ncbi:MAG: flavin reductase [Defluviitaleaceae bacterium]|nr:flavin reductase [Defluviitaleaceae bacterium]
MNFKTIDPKDLHLNPITTLSEEWPLITAGNEENGYNTMTISWGHIGSLWGIGGGRPTFVAYVRPQRHTFGFMNANDMFTISVLPSDFKEAKAYIGRTSGRDEDKVAKAGLTPIFDQNTTYFAEAKMVFVCRKLYQAPILEEGFVDKDLMAKVYPDKDYHTMYVGEIVGILAKE